MKRASVWLPRALSLFLVVFVAYVGLRVLRHQLSDKRVDARASNKC